MEFLPNREAELVTWSGLFSSGITTLNTAVGISPAQATAYAALNTTWVAKYNATQDESTNSTAARIEKDLAKKELIANARLLAGIIQKFPGTTDAQRAQLNLSIKDVEPTPVPIPGQAQLMVKGVEGNTVKVRVIDPANPTKRGRPAGVQGVHVYTHVGETYPAELSLYQFQGAVTRAFFNVEFPVEAAATAAKVWIVVAYYNPRGEEGQASIPVFANLQIGSVESA
jgi:hypothetical protein